MASKALVTLSAIVRLCVRMKSCGLCTSEPAEPKRVSKQAIKQEIETKVEGDDGLEEHGANAAAAAADDDDDDGRRISTARSPIHLLFQHDLLRLGAVLVS